MARMIDGYMYFIDPKLHIYREWRMTFKCLCFLTVKLRYLFRFC